MSNEMEVVQSESIEVKLFIAGDAVSADIIIRKYCKDVGLCVTVTPTKYIYTGGAEDGMEIGFINYPRFPDTLAGIVDKATELGMILMEALSQWSFTVVGPYTSKYYTVRGKK